MIAAPLTHADLPMRGTGVCGDCGNRCYQPGDAVRVRQCSVHGHQVHTRNLACTAYTRDLAAKVRSSRYNRLYKRRYNAEIADGTRNPKTGRLVEPAYERPVPVLILPTVCPKCGSELRRDYASLYCTRCWTTAWDGEAISYRRPVGDCLPTLHRTERWGT